MSPSVYLALCALVKDALEVEESDAAPVLRKAATELAGAIANLEGLPSEIQTRLAAIRAMGEDAATPQKSAA